MAAIELTRMDFHVSRFIESEDVEEMDACEVGQFCLLLFKAWLLAKDVTLTTDDAKLAKYARVDKVSPLVLKQFPVEDTFWGPRRRNPVQLSVWEAAKARSDAGKTAAAKRWDKRPHSEGNATSNGYPMLEQAQHIKHIKHIKQEKQGASALETYSDKII